MLCETKNQLDSSNKLDQKLKSVSNIIAAINLLKQRFHSTIESSSCDIIWKSKKAVESRLTSTINEEKANFFIFLAHSIKTLKMSLYLPKKKNF